MKAALPQWDIAVVGAGAAGLAAAIFAAEVNPAARVALFDGAARIGAKILVAGGGRCNVTHWRVTPDDYNAASRSFVKNVLAGFTADDAVQWFSTMGVTLKREVTGKLFPTTDKARTVLDALLARLHQRGVVLHTSHRVTAITRAADAATSFELTTSAGAHRAQRLVLCTGGRSLPKSGSDGGGYALAAALGHTVTQTHPALVSMTLQQHFFHASLSGASHFAEIATLADGKLADRRSGALLWTHFGLSGPLCMDASRHWLAAKLAGQKPEWRLSVLPGQSFESVEAAWLQKIQGTPRLTARAALSQLCAALVVAAVSLDMSDAEEVRWLDEAVDAPAGGAAHLPEKVQAALLGWCDVDPAAAASQLKREERRKLITSLIALPLPVEQDRGWNHAEVTAGGIPLAEVSWRTMESRIAPGLHLAGEILDVDGRIGGFNFQWAWATGNLAGRAAAAAVCQPV